MTEIIDRLLRLAVEIQQIPAPTFGERRRAEFIRRLFSKEKLRDVSVDSLNNVYGRLPGRVHGRPLVVSAHLDTVLTPEAATKQITEDDRIHGPGIGDNSLGVAALLGLLWMLRDRNAQLEADLWFAADSCEEGLGNLRGMKEVVGRFGSDVRGYLVIEGTALGQVYHRAVGVRRYRVTARTAGGHSWTDYGQPSAIHELAGLIAQLTSLRLPSSPRTTLNVGLISGGSGVNVLASEAQFELDLRSETMQALTALVERVEERVRAAVRQGITIDMQAIGERPAGEISIGHPLAVLAAECISEQGMKATFTSGSTDANIPLSLGIPAIVLGITTGAGAHTMHEYIDIRPVTRGMNQLVRFVERVLAG
jgi:acetylornithine deacetylase/succinyl-diaminopimelate desuccinylase-like protein